MLQYLGNTWLASLLEHGSHFFASSYVTIFCFMLGPKFKRQIKINNIQPQKNAHSITILRVTLICDLTEQVFVELLLRLNSSIIGTILRLKSELTLHWVLGSGHGWERGVLIMLKPSHQLFKFGELLGSFTSCLSAPPPFLAPLPIPSLPSPHSPL